MRFTELRKEISANINEVNSTNDYIKKYLSTPLQDRIAQLNEKFVDYLYVDLAGKEIEKDIKSFLGGVYFTANEYAKACITTAFRSKDIYGLKVPAWTDSALKCFDNFILVLIQEKLRETIKKTGDKGIERQKYHHLIEKGGDYYIVGMGLDVIYQQRNEFTHIEIIDDKSGHRKQLKPSNKTINKRKQIILENFEKALLALDKVMG
jgi:hypothetical protein